MKRYLLPLLLLWVRAVYAQTTIPIYANSDDGEIVGDGTSSYAVAHATGNDQNFVLGFWYVGQDFTPTGGYAVYRDFVSFNTSTDNIPSGATVTSAILGFAPASGQDFSVVDFDIQIRDLLWASPATLAQDANYDAAIDSVAAPLDVTLCNTVSCSANGTGLQTGYRMSPTVDVSWINAHLGVGGRTTYALVSRQDVLSAPPIGHEYFGFDSSRGARPPVLYVSYTLASPSATPPPTLTPTPTRTPTLPTTPTRLPCFDGSPGPNCTPPRCGEVTIQ